MNRMGAAFRRAKTAVRVPTDREKVALTVAAVALAVSLFASALVYRQTVRNRHLIDDSHRGLACLLQRAEISAAQSRAVTERDLERKNAALRFYRREINELGGPRTDCRLEEVRK